MAGSSPTSDRRWPALPGLVFCLLSAWGAAVPSCAIDRPYIWVEDLPAAPDTSQIIAPRDTILVVVHNQAALSGEFVVGDQGDYPQPTLGPIPAAGKTPEMVSRDLEDRLKGLLIRPEASVSIAKVAPIRVNVVGEVKTPGSYELPRGRGVLPALAAAGWLNEFANRDRIFVIRSEPTGARRIRFRAGELTAAEAHAIGFRLKDGDVVVAE